MTFSIVARDPDTGAFGVATATAGPMVGALVPHIRQGFGVAATQAMTNPYLAVDTLSLIGDMPADAALQTALAADEQADLRQIIAVDRTGLAAGWTGGACIGYAGHEIGDGVAVAGNMLTGAPVLEEMMAAYRAPAGGGFAAALFGALRAGAAAGGDKRGVGSAALRVQGGQAFADIDLRVDQSDDPIAALEALLALAVDGPYAEFFASVPRR